MRTSPPAGAAGLISLFLIYLFFLPLDARGPGGVVSGPLQDTTTSGVVRDVGTSPGESAGVISVAFDNGIAARIYPSAYLEERTLIQGSEGILTLDDGGYLIVLTEVNDPSISNKGDGSFHPLEERSVIEALSQITYTEMNLALEVYLLPFPRKNALSSSTSGSKIFLSPQVREISFEGTSYILTHEVGHVFQNRYLPDRLLEGWREYRRLRGIEDTSRFFDAAPHPYRPGEIFAEDFRVLFGGEGARFGGQVENPELPSPLLVPGLKDFFLGLRSLNGDESYIVTLGNYPNPFNPETEIRVVLSDGFFSRSGMVTVRIYDVRGALVRELFSGVPGSAELCVSWDGMDQVGRRAASGVYFCLVRAGMSKMTKKLLLLK